MSAILSAETESAVQGAAKLVNPVRYVAGGAVVQTTSTACTQTRFMSGQCGRPSQVVSSDYSFTFRTSKRQWRRSASWRKERLEQTQGFGLNSPGTTARKTESLRCSPCVVNGPIGAADGSTRTSKQASGNDGIRN